MDKFFQTKCLNFIESADADALAFSFLDFKASEFESFVVTKKEFQSSEPKNIWFDLASLTKPLTNSYLALKENNLSQDLELLLNHKAGLPAWAILDKSNWREYIKSFSVKESETLYSDLSALRFMLEMEDKYKINYRDYFKPVWKGNLKYWLDLDGSEQTLQNGFYGGKPNIGKVHDPNAYNLKTITSHAGVFGTIDGLSNVLLNMNESLEMLEKLKNLKRKARFTLGFDTVGQDTLAGGGCSPLSFGHLGFTGTSFWIDPELQRGWVLLSNSTKYFWFNKTGLNTLRRELGERVWKN